MMNYPIDNILEFEFNSKRNPEIHTILTSLTALHIVIAPSCASWMSDCVLENLNLFASDGAQDPNHQIWAEEGEPLDEGAN